MIDRASCAPSDSVCTGTIEGNRYSRENVRLDPADLSPQTGDHDALRAALADLSTLTGQIDLKETLVRIAELAVSAVPGADGAGLTLTAAHDADRGVTSARFVGELEAVQYGVEEGPCSIAACEARTIRSGSLMTDRRWPGFGSRVGHLGVHSALAIPLRSAAGVLGVMNVYAHRHDTFDDHAQLIGEQFAVPVTVAVHNAQVLARARRLVLQLQGVLAHRAVIDQAIGIVRSRHGGSADDASDWLRQASRAQNQELHTVARNVLDDAVRQVHAEHGPDLTL